MDIISNVVATIREARLPAELYRTARELLDLAGDNGQVKISKVAMMDICGTQADGTMRRQLYALKKAGLVHVSINDHVHVSFVGFPTIDQMITTRAPEIIARASEITPRAPEITPRAPEITPRAPEITPRAPEITPRALPHTRGDRLIDRSSNPIPEAINQSISPAQTGPHRTPRQPWEAPLSYQLLTDKRIAMRRADAERLAACHPFHSVRDAVAYWWEHRKCSGGRFEDYPGIVVYWLDNPEESVIPVMSEEFARSQLCRDYLTPDEVAAEQAPIDEPPCESADPPPAWSAAPDQPEEEGTPEWAWQQVKRELELDQGGTFDRWLHDTHVAAYDPDENTFTVALPDAFRYDWIVNRLSKQIKRKLAVITHRPVQLKFTVEPGIGRGIGVEPNPRGDREDEAQLSKGE